MNAYDGDNDMKRCQNREDTNKYAKNVYPIYLDKSTAKWH